jgi:hypothetical protein
MALPAAYVGLFQTLSTVANKHGYALALHGSLARDMDVFAMPWVEEAIAPAELIQHLTQSITFLRVDMAMDNYTEDTNKFRGRIDGPERKPHGRLAWNIHLGMGCTLDISVMPRQSSDETRLTRQQFRAKRNVQIYRDYMYNQQTLVQLCATHQIGIETIRGVIQMKINHRRTADAKAGLAHIVEAGQGQHIGTAKAYEVKALRRPGSTKGHGNEWVTISKPLLVIEAQREADLYNRDQTELNKESP